VRRWRAAPDGCTFLIADVGQVSINQFFYAKLPYDPVKDFVPVSLIATANLFLVANAGVPVKDFAELVGACETEAWAAQLRLVGDGQHSPSRDRVAEERTH
jgi:tripartite-type tricarboxylate transporter receptor subunit TctC